MAWNPLARRRPKAPAADSETMRETIALARLEGDDYGGTPRKIRRSVRNVTTYWKHYRDNPLVRSAVTEVVHALMGIPLVAEVWDSKTQTWTLLPPEDNLQTLLRNPSRTVPAATFWGNSYTENVVTGNLYYLKRRIGSGTAAARLFELFPREAQHTRPVAGSDDVIGGYIWNPDTTIENGQQAATAKPHPSDVTYKASDVIHIPLDMDPDYPLMGLSPLAAALADIDLDNAITEFTIAIMENGAVVEKAFVSKNPIEASEARRIQRQWKRDHSGPQNAGNLPIIDGADGSLQSVGMSIGPRDMALVDMKKVIEARVLMALDVPPIIVGSVVGLENSTYSNYGQARLAFHEENTDPNLRRFCSALELGLAGEFPEHTGKLIRIRPDTSRVMSLLDWEDQRIRLMLAANSGGLLTQDESRAAIDRAPLGNGDWFAVPGYVNRIKAGSSVEMVPLKPPPNVADPPSERVTIADGQEQTHIAEVIPTADALQRVRNAIGSPQRLMRELIPLAAAAGAEHPEDVALDALRSTPVEGESKRQTAERLIALVSTRD